MTKDELAAKYPRYKIIYEPKQDCRFCHGTGEVKKGKERDIISPCICTCVHHSLAERAQDTLNKMAKEFRESLESEREARQ